MIFTVAVYAGLFSVPMKLLPTLVRRYPNLRNPSALGVELLAAWGVANALAILARWYLGSPPDAPILNFLLAVSFALGMNFLGTNTSSSAYPVWVPFVGMGCLMFFGTRPISVVVGVGTTLAGLMFGWLKYKSLRAKRPVSPAREEQEI